VNGIINLSEILEEGICGLPVNAFCARLVSDSFDRVLPVERPADLFPLTKARQFSTTLYPRSSAFAQGLWT